MASESAWDTLVEFDDMIGYDDLAVARSQGNVKNVFDDFHYSNWESSIAKCFGLNDVLICASKIQ